MTKYGLYKTLDGDEFYRKVFELEQAFCIQERLDRFEFSERTPSDLLSSGRVFNDHVELRWDNGHFAMLWEIETTESVPQAVSVFHCDDKPVPLLLWRGRDPAESYPKVASQIVAVRYTKHGVTRFVRFKGVK